MQILICKHCGEQVPRNKKLKHLNQQYCGARACQSARKLSHEREKYRTNSLYRTEKLRRARERKKALSEQGDSLTSSRYQHDYRASHPEYVNENRQKQRERNLRKTNKTPCETKIVNPDALMLQKLDNETIYAMIGIDCKKIVNPDALMSQLTNITSVINAKPMFVRLL